MTMTDNPSKTRLPSRGRRRLNHNAAAASTHTTRATSLLAQADGMQPSADRDRVIAEATARATLAIALQTRTNW